MTSPNETLEVVEVTWKIPNFLQSNISNRCNREDSLKQFYVGGRVPPADLQALSSVPVKLEAWLVPGKGDNKAYHVVFRVSDRSKLPSTGLLMGKLMDLKTFCCVNTTKDVNVNGSGKINFLSTSYFYLFRHSEVESHLDKDDGSLKIYFKLEITHNLPMPSTTVAVNGGVTVLLNDFEFLLKDPISADVEIKVSQGGGQTFQCHKGILAARSPIFRSMFASDMKETNEGVVEVDDILPKTMEHFISFLYCGRFPDSSWILSLPQLAYAAEDKYCVESLRSLCDLHFIEAVTLRNALTLGKLAERHGLKKAAEDIRTFIAANAREVTLDTELAVDTSNSDPNFNVVYSIPCPPRRDQESHLSPPSTSN